MISTHILDTSQGSPAQGVAVRLELQGPDASWTAVSTGVTNEDGRTVFAAPQTLQGTHAVLAGTYRIHFEVEPYFVKQGQPVFFPTVSVVFKVENTQRKYHVPLLLNPYGYSTYRGS